MNYRSSAVSVQKMKCRGIYKTAPEISVSGSTQNAGEMTQKRDLEMLSYNGNNQNSNPRDERGEKCRTVSCPACPKCVAMESQRPVQHTRGECERPNGRR